MLWLHIFADYVPYKITSTTKREDNTLIEGVVYQTRIRAKYSLRVSAIALICIDPRFRRSLRSFLRQTYNRSYDVNSFPGAVKALNSGLAPLVDAFIEAVKVGLCHGATEVALVNHLDCLGYGGKSAFESKEDEVRHHAEELRAAAQILSASFPDVEIKGLIVELIPIPGAQVTINRWGDEEMESDYDYWTVDLGLGQSLVPMSEDTSSMSATS